VLVLLLLAVTVFADDSPLVKASKASKAQKKKSSTKVITNADVKKSKGNLVVLQPTAMPPVPPAPSKSPLELQADQRKEQAAADAQRAAAQKKVSDLEQQLARIEQSYYEENDPVVRDTKIAKEFALTKQKLDATRRDLP
jgi:hypothetical protein